MLSSISKNEINFSESNLPQSIEYLIASLLSSENLTPELVRQLIVDANIQEDDLLLWETFNHPVTHGYGRKLVFDGGYFEIMVMSWRPGDFSAIHDHGFTQWGAVQSFGRARHISYELKENILKTQHQMWFEPHQVVTVNHDLIHQMGNQTDEYFLSLHVYGCNDRYGGITSDARIFDLWEGSIQSTNGGVFFCLPETEISQRQYNLQGDLSSTLLHHQLMLDRINYILEDSDSCSYAWKLRAELLESKIKQIIWQINSYY